MKHIHYYIILPLLFSLMAACSDYESFSDSPGLRLTFSTDTVAFDTIISTIPSSTKTLYAYNRNSDGLRISTIQLEKGETSYFRVNVNGRYLVDGIWNDFEVLGDDSLIIRVEMTPPETHSTEPLYFTDRLHFLLENGQQQTVLLSGGSLDAYIQKGMNIESDMTLLTDKPYVIYDSLSVQKGATLTLLAGTTLMFHDKAALRVYGRLDVQGTIEQPVVLRGDRMDHMFDYLRYDNTPSRWEGVIIDAGSFGNTFTHCDLHSACFGILYEDSLLAAVDENKPAFTLDGCVIHNIGGDGLHVTHGCCRVVNTQISNTQGNTVHLDGGAYSFIYSTIAQFYPFTGREGVALHLVSSADGEEYGLLRKAEFVNCVITGYGNDQLMGENIDLEDPSCRILFHHCFINTPEVEGDDHFVDCVWDQNKNCAEDTLVRDKNFLLFDTKNYLYDFTPKAESRIRGLADPSYPGLSVDVDAKGNSRHGDGNPDAGCYEYTEPVTTEP